MKPNIVFFGEGLNDTFHKSIEEDKHKVLTKFFNEMCNFVSQADLLVVIGSSLKVRPVSLLPGVYAGVSESIYYVFTCI